MSEFDARAKMEAQATKMTLQRIAKRHEIDKKFARIKKFNSEHPIVPTETVVVYQNEPSFDEIARESARWIGSYHARILGAFGFGSKKK